MTIRNENGSHNFAMMVIDDFMAGVLLFTCIYTVYG